MEENYFENAPVAKKKRRRPLWATVVLRILAVLGVVIVSLVVFVLAATDMICNGPSPTFRDKFVVTVMETSAAKFLARMHYTDAEIDEIIARNSVKKLGEVTDAGKIEIAPPEETPDYVPIEVVDVSGPTFKGKMMIVRDPARVTVATLSQFGTADGGKRVEDFVKESGAVAGVNGGGFADAGGVGNGGVPTGVVIKDSKIVYGPETGRFDFVGFDSENKLIVGNLSGREALDMGMRDGLTFDPTLIVNGSPAEVQGTGGGLNPRTAIGQRADGAVLILVIDGRQASSIGASFEDVIDVMLDFDAVNAGNLDGGSSSLMVYEGEVITVCASLYGSRKLPSAFIVLPEVEK